MESKIDIGSFEALVRAVEMKADRNDPSSYRNSNEQQFEMDRRLQDLEKQTLQLSRDYSLH